jgi:tRNA(adenine34) deaminase
VDLWIGLSRPHEFYNFAAMDDAPLSIFSDESFMKQALQEAELAYREEEVPIGAVIVCQNRIIGRGHNQVERLRDATAHAEMLAITAASDYLGSKFLEDCTLYVTIEPCVMCAGALRWVQIPRIVYGASEPKVGYSRFGDGLLHPKSSITRGVMAEECAALMRRFFQERRKSN